MIKIGTVELTEEEAQRYYDEGRYLVTYSRIYKIIRKNGTFRGKEVHAAKGMTMRGRFYAMDAATIRDVFGIELA